MSISFIMRDIDLGKWIRKNESQKNIERFPEDFMVELTLEEAASISRSQNVTLNDNKVERGSNIKYTPMVFTESGIYMLMTVLKSELAIRQSKILIRIF